MDIGFKLLRGRMIEGGDVYVPINDPLVLEIPADRFGKKIYIDGLVLKAGENFASKAILSVANHSSMEVYVSNLQIQNDEFGEDSCLNVLGGVTVYDANISNCDVGIIADADVAIENSKVYSGVTGIEGVSGVKIEHTLSYGNTDSDVNTPPEEDAIKIPNRTLTYYEAVEENGVPVTVNGYPLLEEKEFVDGVAVYGDKKPYIAIPESLGDLGGVVELYKTHSLQCATVVSHGQACGVIGHFVLVN